MTREESISSAKDNLLVADSFQRQAEDIIFESTVSVEDLTKEQMDDIKHFLSCANAHRWSAVEYLAGKF